MILTMQSSTAIAAGQSVGTALNGQLYERPPFDAFGTLYVNGSAAGVFATLNVDGTAVSDEVQCNIQNRIPVVPDDLLLAGWEAPQGGLIQLKLRNNTVGALTAFWKILLQSAQ